MMSSLVFAVQFRWRWLCWSSNRSGWPKSMRREQTSLRLKKCGYHLIQTAGVVTFSLLINGSMAGVLYKVLHVYDVNPSMKVIQQLAVKASICK